MPKQLSRTKKNSPLRRLKQTPKFNTQFALLIGILLVLSVGYLFLRLTRAATVNSNPGTGIACPIQNGVEQCAYTPVSRPTSGDILQITVTQVQKAPGTYVVLQICAVRSDIDASSFTQLKMNGGAVKDNELASFQKNGRISKSYASKHLADGYTYDWSCEGTSTKTPAPYTARMNYNPPATSNQPAYTPPAGSVGGALGTGTKH